MSIKLNDPRSYNKTQVIRWKQMQWFKEQKGLICEGKTVIKHYPQPAFPPESGHY